MNEPRDRSMRVSSLRRSTLIALLGVLLLSSVVVAQPLSGAFTVGGDSPDYPSLSEAVADLVAKGVNGPVTFNIRPGEYVEQVKIDSIEGTSHANVVTFQSETGNAGDVVIRHAHTGGSATANRTVLLDHAGNLIFRHLTLQADDATPPFGRFNRVLYITNNSNNILFENNRIVSWHTEQHSFETNDCVFVGAEMSPYLNNDSIRFTGNVIIGGAVGIHFKSRNDDEEERAGNWTVEDNIFIDQGWFGLSMEGGADCRIAGNRFHASASTGHCTGIQARGLRGMVVIDGNYINLEGGGFGISVEVIASRPDGPNLVSNNMIRVGRGPEGAIDPWIGISSRFNDSLLIAHNSIYMSAANVPGRCISSWREDTILVFNNHLVNAGGGPCYYSQESDNGVFVSDYNNLYNGGAVLAELNDVFYSSISDLSAGLSVDEHSISEDPMFPGDSLLISSNPLCYENGTPLPAVLYDYFGTLRSTTAPDIGAYEGSVAAVDEESNLLNSSDAISAYPNPADGLIRLVGVDGIFSYAVYDAEGRKCMEGRNVHVPIIDAGLLPDGAYLIRVERKNSVRSVKFVKG